MECVVLVVVDKGREEMRAGGFEDLEGEDNGSGSRSESGKLERRV